MLDPTIEEMREFLRATTPDADEFDREQAIYWDDCFDALVLKYAADTLDNPGG
jgi:hypothetical protein